jgi:hypothetical protein
MAGAAGVAFGARGMAIAADNVRSYLFVWF